MEIQEFMKFIVSAVLLAVNCQLVSSSEFGNVPPLRSSQCTSRNDIPVIKVTSYTRTVPLEDPESKHIIFNSFTMARRKLLKEPKPTKNVTIETVDICLGEGGEKEWSVPASNRTAFISELVIECFDQGLGPVEFEYNGIGDFKVGTHEEMLMTSTNGSFKHLYMPTSYKLVFKNISDQISGNYSCRSVENPEKVNYFHLYVPNDGKPYLIQRGKTINVTQDVGSSLVTLPCIANSPEARVYLFKKFVVARLGIVIVKYQYQPFHIYDPKTGFVIDTSDRGVDPYGTYVCTSNPDIRDPSDRIRINLIPPQVHITSRKADGHGHRPPSIFHMGSQLMKESYRRLRNIVNSFFI